MSTFEKMTAENQIPVSKEEADAIDLAVKEGRITFDPGWNSEETQKKYQYKED